eukprot:CAMPEP_0119038770 /NCGR_PEP_ID=MMETSP1177-20130426/7884_1 /TAXON_ID=2985 /ORGANISM="Ochromonas sp, Strain CCMP1899" /LENGTH=462 /DNA_ID=CAMNT_0007001787 /DNA_START=152 /DNA_END=1540 /DNA_ORIENTATION=+
MYVKDELIEEEEAPEVVKDSEYWKNKKKRRSFYRKKSQIILEDSTPRGPNNANAGVQFEGKVSNVSMADLAETGSSTMVTAKHRAGEPNKVPFKYVLLQVVKKDVVDEMTKGVSSATEVNVIPVSDWYQFKKPSVDKERFLDEIDDEFELKQRKDKEKLEKYKRIAQAMKTNQNKFDGDKDGILEDGDESGRFNLPAIFGSSAGKSIKSGKLFKKEKVEKHLDENGMDLDQARSFDDYCKGDYTTERADDEDDVGGEQMELDEKEDIVAGQGVYEHSDDGDGDSDDEEEEEEDEEEEGGGGASAKLGLVDETMEISAKEFKRKMAVKEERAREKGVSGKREHEEEETNQRKRMRVESDIETTAPSSSSVIAASSTVSVKGTDDYEMSDEGVRKYITNAGGRVKIADLKEVFKKQRKTYTKAHPDEKKSGDKRLLDIILRVTKNVEDPLMGTALCLKESKVQG